MSSKNICIIGAKDIDTDERIFLNGLGVKMYTLFDIDRFGIYRVMEETLDRLKECDIIHLSFDVDVLDPLIAPGTGILSKGGLSYREASHVMEALGKSLTLGNHLAGSFVRNLPLVRVVIPAGVRVLHRDPHPDIFMPVQFGGFAFQLF